MLFLLFDFFFSRKNFCPVKTLAQVFVTDDEEAFFNERTVSLISYYFLVLTFLSLFFQVFP